MGFLRRLVGRDEEEGGRAAEPDPGATPVAPWPRGADDHLPEDEAERDRALLRADAERLDDELIQRQLRYADRSWTPPPQGGDQRSDDEAEGSR